ncbi:MAG: ABC transporter ATP-binding protein [Acidobacteriota bacterium]
MNPVKALELRRVRKSYRFFTLDGASFEVAPGETLGLVGPNGAGKSTSIRLALGLITADAGEVRLLGHPMPAGQVAAKADVGFASAEMRLFPHASLGWHMEFMRGIFPAWDEAYAATLLDRFGLDPAQSASSLSLGEHAKAVLLLALARRPRLLVLDEPTTGLDPVARHEVLAELADVMRDERRSILFSSHNTVDVERLSDRITFLDRGRVVASDDKESFLERWRRIHLRLPAGEPLADLPEIVGRSEDGGHATLITNRFSDSLPARLPGEIREVQRMSLEEIFVAAVMAQREERKS